MGVKRRQFVKLSSLAIPSIAGISNLACGRTEKINNAGILSANDRDVPLVLSTWNHGFQANEVAWKILSNGGAAIDAVEKGVRVVESDPNVRTVGIGGFPDRDGVVTLDACIMDHNSNCGSVAFLQHIENPISVARKVMDSTPHVMLAGEGALKFALANGFKKKNLLTEASKRDYEKWLEDPNYVPEINVENHDTISMLALDSNGDLSGSCTTSGAAWKMHGRIGDSPIIGAGLFVDNEVGAACATGLGEAVMRVSGSAMVVEMMRQGMSPASACKQIVERIVKKHNDMNDIQVGFLALNKDGEYGAYSVYYGFNYAIHDKSGNRMVDSVSKY